jgi:hypothetical protein
MYADPRLEVQKSIANMTIGEVVGSAGETIVAMVKDPLARNIDVPPPRNMGGYGGGVSTIYDLVYFTALVVRLRLRLHTSLVSHPINYISLSLYTRSIRVHLRVEVNWLQLPMGSGPWHPIVVLVQSMLHKTLIPIGMLPISKHEIQEVMPFRGHNKMEEQLAV